jgi:hypothetical protein
VTTSGRETITDKQALNKLRASEQLAGSYAKLQC